MDWVYLLVAIDDSPYESLGEWVLDVYEMEADAQERAAKMNAAVERLNKRREAWGEEDDRRCQAGLPPNEAAWPQPASIIRRVYHWAGLNARMTVQAHRVRRWSEGE